MTSRQTDPSVTAFNDDPLYRFTMPRFVYLEDPQAMTQGVSGLARVKERIRGVPA